MILSQQTKLTKSAEQSLLSRRSHMQSQAVEKKNKLAAGVTLTSLVDVFTILVVYLLVATSIGVKELRTKKEIVLPTVTNSEAIPEGLSVQMIKGKYFVNEKLVSVEDLVAVLRGQLGKNEALIIQADKKATYMDLNPLVLSGLQAGFKKISFAVIQEDKI